MSIWESAGSTYVEAATSALPLHRLVVFAGGLFSSLAISKQTHPSVFESIARMPIAEISNIATGPLSKATVADVLAAIAAVVGGWFLCRISLRGIFSLAAKVTDLQTRTHAAIASHRPDPKLALDDRKKTLELIDLALDEPRKQLRRLSSASEMLGGLSLVSIFSGHWGGMLDMVVGVSLAAIMIGIQVASVRLFFRDYFGPALYRAQLIGKRPPEVLGVT